MNTKVSINIDFDIGKCQYAHKFIATRRAFAMEYLVYYTPLLIYELSNDKYICTVHALK